MSGESVIDGASSSEQNAQDVEKQENLRRARLWLRIDGAVHKLEEWIKSVSSRRHPSERGPDPDYAPRLRVKPRVHIENYTEGGKPPSWQNWGMKIVQSLIATGIAGLIWVLSSMNSRLSSIESRQTAKDVAQEQRLTADEDRLKRLEGKVFP